MLDLVFLLLGFIPLILGANLLVDNASSLAKRLGIPDIVIGLTIIAFGTSAPELVVNVFSSVSGSSAITFGNVVGSNIINILLILGVSSVIYPLRIQTNTVWNEIPLCLLAAFVLVTLAADSFLDGMPKSAVTRVDGIVLLLFFAVFMAYNIQMMKTSTLEDTVEVVHRPIALTVLLILTGLLLLSGGGRMIVTFAVKCAQYAGISERVIGLTVVSLGTSLPELATSAVAAFKKNADIAVGNIVGSNIFNTFFILGISAVIAPVTVPDGAFLDLGVNMIASLLLFVFVFTGTGRQLERWEGTVFLVLYGVFTLQLVF